MPSTLHIVSSNTPEVGEIGGLTKLHPDKVYVACGRIATADYSVGDTVVFDALDIKEVVYARFTGNAVTKEIYKATDISSPITLDLAHSSAKDPVDFVIWYHKGSSSGVIKLTIASS